MISSLLIKNVLLLSCTSIKKKVYAICTKPNLFKFKNEGLQIKNEVKDYALFYAMSYTRIFIGNLGSG